MIRRAMVICNLAASPDYSDANICIAKRHHALDRFATIINEPLQDWKGKFETIIAYSTLLATRGGKKQVVEPKQFFPLFTFIDLGIVWE